MEKAPVLILTAEEEKKPCLFLGNCSSMGNSTNCSLGTMEGCGEAIARKDRANQNCPLMVKDKEKNRKCYVPQLLPFLPLKFDCYKGVVCVLCEIAPGIVDRVAKHNCNSGRSKMSDTDIEKAGAAIIEAIKKILP